MRAGKPKLSDNQITKFLDDMSRGDSSASDFLLPLVYDELRELAASFFRGRNANETLQPTALVHEAYVKLVAGATPEWANRKHFFCVAARAMRQLLTDNARRRKTEKRGGNLGRVTLHDSSAATDQMFDVDIVELDEAISRLASLDERQARIVELRFLAGLSVEETAEALDISERTVKLDWQMARAWLRRELNH
ncbi:MAG: sigma-70 family RNA polymerase sigma factor [Phycisphaerae bacterium]